MILQDSAYDYHRTPRSMLASFKVTKCIFLLYGHVYGHVHGHVYDYVHVHVYDYNTPFNPSRPFKPCKDV
jgi:hypothetical protein